MRKKIVVKAPALSRSGYGEQSRFCLRALRAHEDKFDIFLINIPWGKTGQISANTEERQWLQGLLLKTATYFQHCGGKPELDVSIQITIPNEFEKMAPVNIGYTSGIETTKIAPIWIQKCNETVDHIITISEHSKAVLANTSYDISDNEGNLQQKDWKITVPVEHIDYPVRLFEPDPLNVTLNTTKNFLVFSQWSPRKNFINTIKWFVEEFRDDEDVGLVIKTNTAADSVIDKEITTRRIAQLLGQLGERKCKIHFLHGDITNENLAWLYTHPTMKGIINIAHGEGFGIPLLEAASYGLPILTITWGGQLDFICKPNKKGKRVPLVGKVDYDLNKVQPEAVWEGVIQADSMWAYAREASYKRALRDALEKEKHHKTRARQLQKHVCETFTEEAYAQGLVENILKCSPLPEPEVDIDSWLAELEVNEYE
tara:strand:+ start:7645 stop:8928 length:1284 start_codon:yes stop_codon:yes gene_type:complete